MDLELLSKICHQYNLGTFVCQPVKLKGGFLHKMYSLSTTKGQYAIKLLNPFIMQRESVMENYHIAEKLELILEEKDIPIIPGLIIGNKKMQNIEGQFFYLYEWYHGKALKSREIKEIHCRKTGKLLAQIHKIDRLEDTCRYSGLHINWEFYAEQLSVKNKELYHLLAGNLSLLYEIQNKGNTSIKKLPQILSICHNDMDCKNVLWSGTDCRIIDLECLNYSNPFIELFELALCWSGYEENHINYHLFRCFLRSYAEAGGNLPTDWETIYWSNYGRLEWLEYNLKRALGIECSEEEIEMGISEVKKTIAHMVYYYNIRQDLIKNCITIV